MPETGMLGSRYLSDTPTLKDPTTGCFVSDEACKQTFYLKQQNEILQNNQVTTLVQENKAADSETTAQLQGLRDEIELLKTQQQVTYVPVVSGDNYLTLAIVIPIALVAFVGGLLVGKFLKKP